jgi:hypothetical protein
MTCDVGKIFFSLIIFNLSRSSVDVKRRSAFGIVHKWHHVTFAFFITPSSHLRHKRQYKTHSDATDCHTPSDPDPQLPPRSVTSCMDVLFIHQRLLDRSSTFGLMPLNVDPRTIIFHDPIINSGWESVLYNMYSQWGLGSVVKKESGFVIATWRRVNQVMTMTGENLSDLFIIPPTDLFIMYTEL